MHLHYYHSPDNPRSFGRNDARDDLFSTYNRSASPSKSKTQKASQSYSPYGYSAPAAPAYPGAASGNGNLYPGGSSYGVGGSGGNTGEPPFRAATPNSRGQYSSAVLDELESQNEDVHVGVLTGKVKQLKDVRCPPTYQNPSLSWI